MKTLSKVVLTLGLIGLPAHRAEAVSCEQSFVAQSVANLHVRWRLAAREHYVIDQTDRLLSGEFKDHLPSEIYEAIRVEDFSLVRFDADRVSLVEVTAGPKKPVAHFRIFSAGFEGPKLEVLPFFEVIHKEASLTREWKRMSSISMTHLGFSSNLATWKSLYKTENVGRPGASIARPVFEISRLMGTSEQAAVLMRELAKHQRSHPDALYFGYAKTADQAQLYETLLGFSVLETFQNPRTGSLEFILSNQNRRSEK
ncbi:MAG: hypothetical protein U1E10_09390 [Bdellovibrionales bacterium]|nr:hypothetical protein [Bdellovibrionales bacterium]